MTETNRIVFHRKVKVDLAIVSIIVMELMGQDGLYAILWLDDLDFQIGTCSPIMSTAR